MNIILDINVLIECQYERPYLDVLLLHCFTHFDTVSLLTNHEDNNNLTICGYKYSEILEPIVNAISIKLNKFCTFSHVLINLHKLSLVDYRFSDNSTIIVNGITCNSPNFVYVPYGNNILLTLIHYLSRLLD